MNYSQATITFPFFNIELNPSTHFSVFGYNVYWYAVIIAFGFLLAVIYCTKATKRFGLTEDNLLDCLIVGLPLGIIGARIYYICFNPADYFNPINWRNIINIRGGGLAIYGGVIFAVISVLLVCKIRKIPVLPILDIVGFGFPIGQLIGRWGNFINREAFGKETNVFCKMGLTLNGITRYYHPTFLYESLWNLLGFILMHICSKKHRKYDGQFFLLYLAWYGLGRGFIEGLRTDSLYVGATKIRISQIVGFSCAVVSALILLTLHIKIKSGTELPLHTKNTLLKSTVVLSSNIQDAEIGTAPPNTILVKVEESAVSNSCEKCDNNSQAGTLEGLECVDHSEQECSACAAATDEQQEQ